MDERAAAFDQQDVPVGILAKPVGQNAPAEPAPTITQSYIRMASDLLDDRTVNALPFTSEGA